MRRLIAFSCAGEQLVATLDAAPGAAGVLIVSGGSEPRAGAHRWLAMLAQDLAAAGVPVLRFDRRGVGDSTGIDAGFAASQPDIAAAAALFRRETGITWLVAFGNCDAATALALFGRDCGIDAVVLANPWLRDEADALPPAAAIRSRYARRLVSPAAWWRLLRGGVDLRRLASGLAKLVRRADGPGLAGQIRTGIGGWGNDVTVVLARGDATAIAYAADSPAAARTVTIDTASHSFAGEASRAALAAVLRDAARCG